MKKWIALLLLLAMSLTGCSTKEESEAQQPVAVPAESVKRETAHIHNYEAQVTEGTCTEDGFTEYACQCGDTYVGMVRAASGHSYTDEVFAPTIAADGFTRHTCEVCGDSYEDTVVEMLPDGIEDGTFFHDAVFVGDSIVTTLKVYAQMNDSFGDALFLCRPSYGMRHAADHTMGLTYRGSSYNITDALVACGAKKIFIQLGMNDVATVGPDKTIEYWYTVIPQIQEACPDVQIFIQSGTPIYTERGLLTNENMDAFNVLLEAFATEHGCFFIDIATPVKDENGFLKEEYCHDQYCHLSMEGCAVWVRTLKDYLLEHKGEFA